MARKPQPRRLGRGLSSLISDPVAVTPENIPAETDGPQTSTSTQTFANKSLRDDNSRENVVEKLDLTLIIPNINQPRKAFDPQALEQLASSIRVSGVIQPILVRPLPSNAGGPEGVSWELIAGERRWRAAKLAGLSTIPAIITQLPDHESAEWALVENLQREDLNPVERAGALRSLRDEFGLTQSQVAERVGLDRSSVANLIRLTELEPEILELLVKGQLSAGHGKALLAAPQGDRRVSLAKTAVSKNWSVRQLERACAAQDPPDASAPPAGPSDALRDLEKRLGDHLGTKLRIKQDSNKVGGTITIRYFDLDHFDSLLQKCGYADRVG